MFPFRRRCLIAGLIAALLLAAAQDSAAAQQQSKPRGYLGVVQRLRDAQKRTVADSRDIYPLIEILQGEEYPKAIREAAKRRNDAALLELYQAKHSQQWPRTVKGTQLLAYAAMNGDADVVRLLIGRGADAGAANEEGWTALHHAAGAGNVEIVSTLLDARANVNARTTRFGETPLMLACGLFGRGRHGQSVACARLLIERGADVNARTKDGETALTFAAGRGRVDAVRLLLSRNADATLKDTKGNTALSQVEEFTRIDANGEITYTQDSTSVPVYKLKVFDALVRRGKLRPGLYVGGEEGERKAEAAALEDFLTIARLLREAGD